MVRYTRRQVVAALGATGLGGCTDIASLGGEPPFEQAADPWSNYHEEEVAGGFEATVDISLAAGEWAGWEYQPDAPVDVSYTLTPAGDGPAEVFVFRWDELDRFRERDTVAHYIGLHGTGREPSASAHLNSGDYVIVVDNSAYGDMSPDGDLTATLFLSSQF